MQLRKPVHEVMAYPQDELLMWQVFFSIDDNKDQPTLAMPKQSTKQSIAAFKEAFN